VSEPTPAERVREAAAGRTLRALAEEHGTAAAFGIVSIHNQPLVDALVDAGRYVAVRHEATAVSAADGYSRVADTLGIAVTSTGTGAGNAAGSLIEASTAGSRVLHVTGNIESGFLGQGRGVIHETRAQDAMLAAVSKHAHTVRSADEVGLVLRRAAAQALEAPCGPVSVEIPIDLQYTSAGPAEGSVDAAPETGQIDGDLDRAAALIDAAERPVMWAGGGAVAGREQLAELCRRLGMPLLTSNAGRGVIPEDDPLVVGNFAASDGGQRLLDQADLILSVGTHFRSNETRHYKLRLPGTHVQIDVDPAALGRAYPCDVGLTGTADSVLAALAERLTDRRRDDWCAAAAETRTEVRRALEAAIGPYAELCRSMRDVLPREAPLVRDVTIASSSWGNRLLEVYDPTTNVSARGGGIGQGLGMAIGAATARPGAPTSLMVGDGGFMVHLGELATVAQEQPWLVAVVFNDGGYGVLRNLQDAHFDHRSGVDLANPDLGRLAAAFDLGYERISDPGHARSVLERAVSDGGPVLVELDCDAFGPMAVPFVPPVPVS
jgi:acetolactate synthase-1/2/3 large subunit